MNYMLYANQGAKERMCCTCGNRMCKKVDPDNPFLLCTKQNFKYWIPAKEEGKASTLATEKI